jgi:hypothetical protein
MTDRRQKSSALTTTIHSTYRRCQCICTGDHDAQENFYTRLGTHDGYSTPAIPFGNIQSSLIQPACHSKGKPTL